MTVKQSMESGRIYFDLLDTKMERCTGDPVTAQQEPVVLAFERK